METRLLSARAATESETPSVEQRQSDSFERRLSFSSQASVVRSEEAAAHSRLREPARFVLGEAHTLSSSQRWGSWEASLSLRERFAVRGALTLGTLLAASYGIVAAAAWVAGVRNQPNDHPLFLWGFALVTATGGTAGGISGYGVGALTECVVAWRRATPARCGGDA